MSPRLVAVLALWQTAPEGSSWTTVDTAWWTLHFAIEQAEARDRSVQS